MTSEIIKGVGDITGLYYPESEANGEEGWTFQKVDGFDKYMVIDHWNFSSNPPIPVYFPKLFDLKELPLMKCFYSLNYLKNKMDPYEKVINQYDDWIKSLTTAKMDKIRESEQDHVDMKSTMARVDLLRANYQAQYVDMGKENTTAAKVAKKEIDKLAADIPASSSLETHLTMTFTYSIYDYSTLRATGKAISSIKTRTGTYDDIIDIYKEAKGTVEGSDEYKKWKYKKAAYEYWKEKYAKP